MSEHQHLLSQLRLPSRFESLIATIGPEIAQILVAPDDEVLDVFRNCALHIKARGRGLFLPLHARSGTGKTTLVTSVGAWLPHEFGPTARLAGGDVSADRLRQVCESVAEEHDLPANEKRVIIINVDDRESDPPSDKELSQIKSFLREAGVGSRALVVWPETSLENARKMSAEFEDRAGRSPVPIPAQVTGPPSDTWQATAVATLKLVNGLDSLEELGVDPNSYDPASEKTLGDFLDRIGMDFVALLGELLAQSRKPMRLIVAMASESGKAGVLSELTSSSRYGFLDADKLVGATPGSVIGRWWASRRGLLVQTIVRLDARIVHIAPSLSVPVVRRFGPAAAADLLEQQSVASRPPSDINNYFERADFGRLLLGTDSATAEIRGNPAHSARAAFAALGQTYGFGSGNDKKLNQALGDYLTQGKAELGEVLTEKKLPYLPLIPDLAIDTPDLVTGVEIHWRSGDFLTTTNRSEIAQYALRKLKAYAVESGWTSG
ncbi:hypothetical protein [Aeromicrobium endophyticum]|uniref:hypothetical protein n=1 Tax=Aeromicrobium endophyticum TaxID=2292704 RepID=UPI0011C347FE|nr:hypothetical protein [Aeromicrobium endophyticum]